MAPIKELIVNKTILIDVVCRSNLSLIFESCNYSKLCH